METAKAVSPSNSAKKLDEGARATPKAGGAGAAVGAAAGEGSDGAVNVRVILRVRPMNAKEKALMTEVKYDARGNQLRESCVSFNPDDKTAIAVFTQVEKLDKGTTESYDKHTFNFDYVFECESTQMNVYEIAGKPIIDGKKLD
jgi:hypothetical protein